MAEWKCQSCSNTVDRPQSAFVQAMAELEGREDVPLEEVMERAKKYDSGEDTGAFDVPVGWMKLTRANTFNVFCSWPCLQAFADIWSAIEHLPDESREITP